METTYSKKKNIINLIRYHSEGNEPGFRNEAYEIAKEFDQMGDYQLSEYIQPLDRDEYKKFLGAAGDELDRLMRENQDVLRRLKERD